MSSQSYSQTRPTSFFNQRRTEQKQIDTSLFLPLLPKPTGSLLQTMKKEALQKNDYFFGMDVKDVKFKDQPFRSNYKRKKEPAKFYHDLTSPKPFRKINFREDQYDYTPGNLSQINQTGRNDSGFNMQIRPSEADGQICLQIESPRSSFQLSFRKPEQTIWTQALASERQSIIQVPNKIEDHVSAQLSSKIQVKNLTIPNLNPLKKLNLSDIALNQISPQSSAANSPKKNRTSKFEEESNASTKKSRSPRKSPRKLKQQDSPRKGSKRKLQTTTESSSDEDYHVQTVVDPGKQAMISAIGRMNVHSYNDLQQIKLGLQEKQNCFKVLCCCIALEKLLDYEETLKSLLGKQIKKKKRKKVSSPLFISPRDSKVDSPIQSKQFDVDENPNSAFKHRDANDLLQNDTTFRLSERDYMDVASILLNTLGQGFISEEDFYHEKAFNCMLNLINKVHTKWLQLKHSYKAQMHFVNLQIEMTEEQVLWEDMQRWFVEARGKIHLLLDVGDVKLCEMYWQQIRKNLNIDDSFISLVLRLKLQAIKIKPTKVCLQSKSLQNSISSIIYRVLIQPMSWEYSQDKDFQVQIASANFIKSLIEIQADIGGDQLQKIWSCQQQNHSKFKLSRQLLKQSIFASIDKPSNKLDKESNVSWQEAETLGVELFIALHLQFNACLANWLNNISQAYKAYKHVKRADQLALIAFECLKIIMKLVPADSAFIRSLMTKELCQGLQEMQMSPSNEVYSKYSKLIQELGKEIIQLEECYEPLEKIAVGQMKQTEDQISTNKSLASKLKEDSVKEDAISLKKPSSSPRQTSVAEEVNPLLINLQITETLRTKNRPKTSKSRNTTNNSKTSKDPKKSKKGSKAKVLTDSTFKKLFENKSGNVKNFETQKTPLNKMK